MNDLFPQRTVTAAAFAARRSLAVPPAPDGDRPGAQNPRRMQLIAPAAPLAMSHRRAADAHRSRRRVPAGRALRLGRPDLHPHLGPGPRARAPLPDQPVRDALRARSPPRAWSRSTSRAKVGDSTPTTINPAGFTIHSAVHAAREDARCVLHLHTLAGVAVSCQEDGLLPLNQTAMLLNGRSATTTTRASRSTTTSGRGWSPTSATTRAAAAQPRHAHRRRDASPRRSSRCTSSSAPARSQIAALSRRHAAARAERRRAAGGPEAGGLRLREDRAARLDAAAANARRQRPQLQELGARRR